MKNLDGKCKLYSRLKVQMITAGLYIKLTEDFICPTEHNMDVATKIKLLRLGRQTLGKVSVCETQRLYPCCNTHAIIMQLKAMHTLNQV